MEGGPRTAPGAGPGRDGAHLPEAYGGPGSTDSPALRVHGAACPRPAPVPGLASPPSVPAALTMSTPAPTFAAMDSSPSPAASGPGGSGPGDPGSTRRTPPGSRRAGSDLRAAFLAAAREILDEPETALDLRKVAERAGKSRTAPYLVFGKTEEGGGLEALKVAVATEGFEELVEDVERMLSIPTDPEERVRKLGEAYLAFADRHPRLFRLMFGPEVSRALVGEGDEAPSQERSLLLVTRARLEDRFRRVVEEAQVAGVLEPRDTLLQVLGAWTLFHGAAMLLLDGQLELAGIGSTEQVAALVTPLLLDEAALPVAAAAEALARARVARGFPAEEDRPEGWAALVQHPDPAALAAARRRMGDRIPPEVWEIVGRPPRAPSTELPLARALVTRSTALRRARRMRKVLEGSRILWIDDRPELTAPEVALFRSLGASVIQVQDTGAALDRLRGRGAPFDVILSDVARPHSPSAGVDALPALKEAAPDTPVLFFVAEVDPDRDRPRGSAGITNDPSELLHLVLDRLERTRL